MSAQDVHPGPSMGTTTGEPGQQHPARASALHRALDRLRPGVLLAFRVVVATLFALHPLTALGLLGGPAPGAAMVAISVVELAMIVLLALGMLARAAAFVLSGMMAFAYLVIHLPGGWSWMENGGEPAALYCWIFLLLVVVGPGPISLDGLRARRNEAR